MSAEKADKTPRKVPPGSCHWCGHPPHDTACSRTIQAAESATTPCPCRRSA